MKPPFFAHKHGCPHCGGSISFFAARCLYCRETVLWSVRFEWAGDMGKLFLVTAGVAAGMLFGWGAFHVPKPTPEMGTALVILLWYVQHATWRADECLIGQPSHSTS